MIKHRDKSRCLIIKNRSSFPRRCARFRKHHIKSTVMRENSLPSSLCELSLAPHPVKETITALRSSAISTLVELPRSSLTYFPPTPALLALLLGDPRCSLGFLVASRSNCSLRIAFWHRLTHQNTITEQIKKRWELSRPFEVVSAKNKRSE